MEFFNKKLVNTTNNAKKEFPACPVRFWPGMGFAPYIQRKEIDANALENADC